MNGNLASSPIENNFLPIIDRRSAVISSPATGTALIFAFVSSKKFNILNFKLRI
jgi:hypothetical protein